MMKRPTTGVSCSVLITTDNKGQQYYTSTQFTERLSVALGVLFTASVCGFILVPNPCFPITGSPAEACGLKTGDRILFLNGLDMRCV